MNNDAPESHRREDVKSTKGQLLPRPPLRRRTRSHGSFFAGRTTPHGANRIIGLGVGWLLVLVGLAALVLPGPGMLALVAGLAVLAQQYEWARRWLQPVKQKAFAAAAKAVKSRLHIALSFAGALLLILIGTVWGVQPTVPDWWPLNERWWLTGGWSVGSGLIISGLFATAFIGYSIQQFHPKNLLRQ